MGKTKIMNKPVVSVPYPSTRKPDHPIKIATRVAVQSLKDNGVELAQLHRGYPYIFGLAKHNPNLLKAILRRVKACGKGERKVWREVLSYSYFAAPRADEIDSDFSSTFEIVKLAGEIMRKNRVLNERNALRKVTNHVHPIRRMRPKTKYGVTTLYSAAEVYFEVPVDGHVVNARSYSLRFTVNKDNVDDIIFIADHLAEVKELLPELKKRRIRNRGMIAALLEAGTKPLMDGVL